MSQIEQKIAKLSDGGKVAIVLCANAFRFGGNWGFLPQTRTEYKDYLTILQEEKPHVKVFRVKNGALVTSEENFLAYNVNAVVPNAINGKFVDMATKRRQEEKARFQKFMEKVFTGKASNVEKRPDYTHVTLGIYCINETNAIRINGKDYPAYKLSLKEVLEFLAFVQKKTGRDILVLSADANNQPQYVNLKQVVESNQGMNSIYRALELAESDTGVFLNFRIASK